MIYKQLLAEIDNVLNATDLCNGCKVMENNLRLHIFSIAKRIPLADVDTDLPVTDIVYFIAKLRAKFNLVCQNHCDYAFVGAISGKLAEWKEVIK